MPVYEYYCRSCQTKFEQLRPMKMAEATAVCPEGHQGAIRTISLFSALGRAGDEADFASMSEGGCACGGSCACGAH
jgi:putative FmdB family regulatory protein